jgi:hypothetical protein
MLGAGLILLTLLSAPAAHPAGCENYCVAIRGNGEAVPAHWAALARMVEENGMPKATAGGSSATITMLLLDSMSGNPGVQAEKDAERKRRIQALMLKSMPEFTAAMAKDAKIADGFAMLQAYSGGNKELIEKAMKAFTGPLSTKQLQEAFAKYGTLLNPELVALVNGDPSKFGPEAVKSINNLGKFNAVTDDTIFVRPGLVDFKSTAVVLGYMADFYAGNTDSDTKMRLDAFLADCADEAYRKEWMALGECRKRFGKIAADYLSLGQFQNKAIFQKVGNNASTLPTTSLILGEGLKKFRDLKSDYLSGNFDKIPAFSLNFDSEMGLGYWGRAGTLARVNQGLESYREEGDLKASRFRPLGEANWFEVLSTSPAEPGIASVQKIPMGTTREQVLAELEKPLATRWSGLHYRTDAYSAGGWSDLHPTAVLKAQGCSPVVYLTRHAAYGDSLFGQQIFIRLTGTRAQIPFWEKIGDAGAGGWCADKIRAAGGNPEEVAKTPWARISNLCDPGSSFRRALRLADATYCTDWDNENFGVFSGQVWALVKDSYLSPLIPTTAAGASCKLNPQPGSLDPLALPGCLPYAAKAEGGERAEGFSVPAP